MLLTTLAVDSGLGRDRVSRVIAHIIGELGTPYAVNQRHERNQDI